MFFRFAEDYALRTKEWCYCYRKGLRVNTNMAIESMHRIIKQNYFGGKVIKRLDDALNHILTYLDDKRHDHLIKSTKGKITRKNTNIYNNHNMAKKLKDKFKVIKLDGKFFVSKGEESYVVTIDEKKCKNFPCGVDYKDCGICLHKISCSCFGNSIHYEMCIHCHLALFHNLCNDSTEIGGDAAQQNLVAYQPSEQIQLFDYEIPDIDNDLQHEANLQHHRSHLASKARISVSLSTQKEKFRQRLEELNRISEDIEKSSDPVAISKATDILMRSKLQLKYHVQKQLVIQASNINSSRKRKLDNQKRNTFVSTKKKCTNRKNPLKNPTFAQRKEIRSHVS